MVGTINTQELLQDKRTLLSFWWAGEFSALHNVSGLKACELYHMKYKYCTRRVLDWVLHAQPMKWLKQMRQIVKTRLYTKRHRVTELGITQNNINHWLKPVGRFGLSKQLSQWRQQRGSHKFAYLMRKTMISARSASTCGACRVWKLCTCVFHFDEFIDFDGETTFD